MLKRETTKRVKDGKPKGTPHRYLAEEAEAMARAGYITARQAADLVHVRVDRVYRAINHQKVRVKVGENAYNRYVHRADWLKLMEKQREKVLQSLGLTD